MSQPPQGPPHYSHNPQQPQGPHTNVYVAPNQNNTWGLSGLIVSIVGWFSCGLLCPIGLILSLVGLNKEPKGTAVAGAIIGGLGTIVGLLFVLLGGLSIFGSLACCGASMAAAAREIPVQNAATAIANTYRSDGELPSDSEGDAVLDSPSLHIDGKAIDYQPLSGSNFVLILPGGEKRRFDAATFRRDQTLADDTADDPADANEFKLDFE